MGKPTRVEDVSLDRMSTLASRLEDGGATEKDRDEALGTILKMFVAERRMGLVSVGEFNELKRQNMQDLAAHVAGCPHQKTKKLGWPAASTIITVVLSVVGLIAKFV